MGVSWCFQWLYFLFVTFLLYLLDSFNFYKDLNIVYKWIKCCDYLKRVIFYWEHKSDYISTSEQTSQIYFEIFQYEPLYVSVHCHLDKNLYQFFLHKIVFFSTLWITLNLNPAKKTKSMKV